MLNLYAENSINVLAFHVINDLQNPTFQGIMQVISTLSKYTMFPFYFIVFVLGAWESCKQVKANNNTLYVSYCRQMKEVAISLIAAYIVYLLWVTGLKHVLHMPRPFAVLPEGTFYVQDYIKNAEDPYASLPSGHAAFIMMVLTALWSILNKLGRNLGIFLLLTVSISRVALGVHFPFDIMVSWLLSLIITSLTVKASKALIRLP